MEAHLKYYELLELSPEAGIEEVQRNYNCLKELYSGNSLEITALNTDFSPEVQQDFLLRLDEAYKKLKLLLETQKPVPARKNVSVTMNEEMREWVSTINCFTGAVFKTIRERMGIDLKDVYTATRIQIQYLEDIENERFCSFRAEVYLRSYLIEYARFLSLDSTKVVADYLPRYRKSLQFNV